MADKIKEFSLSPWIDPACADAGSCQSRLFKKRQPLTNEQIFQVLDAVRMQFASDVPTESASLMFARAIERAHGITPWQP